MSANAFFWLNMGMMVVFPISIIVYGIIFIVQFFKKLMEIISSKIKKVFAGIGIVFGLLVLGPVAYVLLLIPYFVLMLIRVIIFGKRMVIRKRAFHTKKDWTALDIKIA